MFDPRWDDARERDDGRARVYDGRDRTNPDPRDGLMHDLDLPHGDGRELVVDRDRVYELSGEDSRTLTAIGAFRAIPERDLGPSPRLAVPVPLNSSGVKSGRAVSREGEHRGNRCARRRNLKANAGGHRERRQVAPRRPEQQHNYEAQAQSARHGPRQYAPPHRGPNGPAPGARLDRWTRQCLVDL
jgi:hypothetical protein